MRKLVLGCVVLSSLALAACGGSGSGIGDSPCESRKSASEEALLEKGQCFSATDREKHKENIEADFTECEREWAEMTEAQQEAEKKLAEAFVECTEKLETCEDDGGNPNTFMGDYNDCKP